MFLNCLSWELLMKQKRKSILQTKHKRIKSSENGTHLSLHPFYPFMTIIYCLHCHCWREKPIQKCVNAPSQEKCTTAKVTNGKISQWMILQFMKRNTTLPTVTLRGTSWDWSMLRTCGMKAGSGTITLVRDRLSNCTKEIIHLHWEKKPNIPEPLFLVGGNQNKVSKLQNGRKHRHFYLQCSGKRSSKK